MLRKLHKYRCDMPDEAWAPPSTCYFWGAVIGAIGSIAGGALSGKGADKAAKTQSAAVERQTQLAENQWNRYIDVYGPLEDQMVAQVSGLGNLTAEERRELKELDAIESAKPYDPGKTETSYKYLDPANLFGGRNPSDPLKILGDTGKRLGLGKDKTVPSGELVHPTPLTEQQKIRLAELRTKASGDSRYVREGSQRLDAMEGTQDELLVDLGNRLTGLEDEYRLDPEAEAAHAGADVAQGFDKQGEINARGRARAGIDPTSGAAIDADYRFGLDRSKADVFAQNTARRNAQETNFTRGMGMYGARSDLAGTTMAAANDAFNRRTGLMDSDLNRQLAVASLGKGLPSVASAGFNAAASQAGNLAKTQGDAAAGVARTIAGLPWGKMIDSGTAGKPAQPPASEYQYKWMDDGSGTRDGGYAEGGEVEGPGTGTSDSIPARLSDGEYVIPADVVRAKGTEFFDKLVERHHAPVGGFQRNGYANGGSVGGMNPRAGMRAVPRPSDPSGYDPVTRGRAMATRLRKSRSYVARAGY